jgi:hypothetical protein
LAIPPDIFSQNIALRALPTALKRREAVAKTIKRESRDRVVQAGILGDWPFCKARCKTIMNSDF